MNRFFIYIFFLFHGVQLSAQKLWITPYNTGYAPVRSYNGATISNLVQIQIHANSSQGIQMQTWSMSYRVVGAISNGGSKNFPVERLKFRFNSVLNSGVNDQGNTANAGNLGLNTNPIPFQYTNSYFVNNSPYNLQIVNRYFMMTLGYDVMVDGGAYLEEYSSWNNYSVNLIIEIRNSKGEIIDSEPINFQMQVHPDDSPPKPVDEYAIMLEPSAKNVLLEFKTPGDYANGVSRTYNRALSVISTTGYTVQVNSLNNDLTSTSNQSLPVNAIGLSVKDSQSQAVMGNVKLLSSKQSIITSLMPAKTEKYFDLTYSTQAGDIRFFNQAQEQYSGTLIFSLIPQ
ncbi:hypothetical protein [Elizabethkingia anophelis]|uniref:hypothetical protein n=1 Tax=Elizabethkingia anophelis TaxID=1117645 RepID=UPI00259B71B9|nr:hypothetical protein [Elizabethkingia anophelis]WJK01870.1 hypothetical protein QTN78_09145 [Elizabethkingia anophelis]